MFRIILFISVIMAICNTLNLTNISWLFIMLPLICYVALAFVVSLTDTVFYLFKAHDISLSENITYEEALKKILKEIKEVKEIKERY